MSIARKSFRERQQDYINSVISGFTFSSDANKLEKQVKQLNDALINPIVLPTNPFYWLSECLARPGKYLQELVLNETEQCTTHDIKLYILEFTHAQLTKAAKTANLTYKKLQWNFSRIIAAIIKEDDKTTWFKSEPAREDGGENPWQLPTISGKIYTRAIREEIDTTIPTKPKRQIFVDVNVTYGNDSSQNSFMVDTAPVFNESNEGRIAEHQFIMTMQTKAEKLALNFAAEFALSKLNEPTNHKNKSLAQPATLQIVTHKYYYDLMMGKKIRLIYFLHSTEQQATNFTDEILINLIKNQLCSYANLKSMTEAQRKTAKHYVYNAMLYENLISIKDICQLNDSRNQFLIHPFVSNLIRADKSRFYPIAKLPNHLFPLLTNSLYCEYFKQNFNTEKLSKLQPYHVSLMLNQTLAYLVKSNQINLDMIADLSENMSTFLKTYCYVIDWVKSGIIQFEEITECRQSQDLAILYAKVYARRLYAIFNNHIPFLINKVTDDIALIKLELTFVTQDIQIKYDTINEWVIYKFLIMLAENLMKENNTSPNYTCEQMLDIIYLNEKGNTSWAKVLEDLIYLAEQYNQNSKPYANHSWHTSNKKSKPHHRSENNISNLCSGLISIKEITLNMSDALSYKLQR